MKFSTVNGSGAAEMTHACQLLEGNRKSGGDSRQFTHPRLVEAGRANSAHMQSRMNNQVSTIMF